MPDLNRIRGGLEAQHVYRTVGSVQHTCLLQARIEHQLSNIKFVNSFLPYHAGFVCWICLFAQDIIKGSSLYVQIINLTLYSSIKLLEESL